MSELAIPDFFISLFKKIFGDTWNAWMCLAMFTSTDAGKKLLDELNAALDTPEGQKLLEQIQGVIKKKIKAQ